MRKALKIALREYSTSVRTKAFLVMIVLAPVMMSGGLITITIMERHKDTTDKRIAVVDRSGLVAEALVEVAEERNTKGVYDPETGEKVRPGYVIEVVPPDDEDPDAQRVALSERVKRKELHAFIEIGRNVVTPGEAREDCRVTYHSENAALDDARGWMGGPINKHIRELRLAAAGVDESARERLLDWVSVDGLGLITIDEATGEVKDAERSNKGLAIGVPAAMMMLMFLMIMVGATPLISAVLEEKMQRIAEVLLGSVRPFELMLGKLLGTLGVSFTVIAIYMAGGIAVAYHLDVADYVPFHILPWFFIYMVAAIVLFGSLLIALGAACNDMKEAQSFMMPVWLLVMIPMFVWLPVVKEPLSSFSTWMSLIPPFTPILMLIRQAGPTGIPMWQPWAGLVGVLLFTTLCVWVGGRIFRVGILMQGKPPRPRDLLRWALRG
jgi:ABC-2 type transport system permease protein